MTFDSAGGAHLKVAGLSLRLAERQLFTDLDLAAGPGTVIAVTGPNGCGKSTLLRVLAGLRDADAGSVLVDGAVHWIGHTLALKERMTGRALVSFWRDLLAGEPGRLGADPFGITGFLDLPVSVLSRGQKQRLALHRLALCHRPIWLLDEPSTSLDDTAAASLDQAIRAHAANGGLAVVATHRPLNVAELRHLELGS